MIWGCPALWAGRAVSQLAGLLGPAGFFAALQKPWVWPSATAIHPSASRCAPMRRLRRLLDPKRKSLRILPLKAQKMKA
ncbi:hypothetical protein SapgrDRAFT_1735 [Saprospira grandis DSM 2844]|uniref:Uncharacterized protein n=1 Tax=Saprospira grandis DSM 2844 TaxID=694433 RepID=J0P0W4_9BACT|nr:hypothetical protein SapgrDRAFT_1735 [Saprospira grandis DSM 2844]